MVDWKGCSKIKNKILWLVAIIILSALILSGCSSAQKVLSQSSKESKKSLQNQQVLANDKKVEGYIYQSPKVVAFMQFTNNKGKLNGTLYERVEDQNNQLQIYNTPISGQIVRNTISIFLKTSGNVYTGNITDNEIVLAVPASDGGITNDSFTPGTLDDFNIDVSKLKSSISNDQQKAYEAQKNKELNIQLNNIEDAINKLVQTIPDDEQALQDDVSNTGKDINSEDSDLECTKEDEQIVMNESASDPQTNSDANQVRSDANQIQSDDNQITADNIQFKANVQALQDDISALSTNFNKMIDLANQINNVIPEYLPKKSDVNDTVNKAQIIIKTTTDKINSYINKSKKVVDSANGLADQAEKYASN